MNRLWTIEGGVYGLPLFFVDWSLGLAYFIPMDTIDTIFTVCITAAMVALTAVTVALCLAGILFLWRVVTENSNGD